MRETFLNLPISLFTGLFALSILFGYIVAVTPLYSGIYVIGFILLVALYIRPVLGLYISVAVSPLLTFQLLYNSPYTSLDVRYPLSFIPIVITFCMWFLHRIITGNKISLKSGSDYILPFLLLFWATISLFWSFDRDMGVGIVFNLTVGILFFILITSIINNRDNLIRLCFFIAFLSPIFGLEVFLSKYLELDFGIKIMEGWSVSIDFFNKIGQNKRPGGFATPQVACNMLGFFIFINAIVFRQLRGYISRVLIILISSFLFFDMLFTASKGGILSFILGTFFLIFFSPALRKKSLQWSIINLFLITLIIAINTLFFQEVRLGASNVAEASLSTRFEFWKTGFKTLGTYLISGTGAGGFIGIIDPVPGAHSIYFSVLFDYSFVGLTIFIAFLIQIVVKIKRAVEICTDELLIWALYCISASLMLMLIHALVDLDYIHPYFWLVMGLAFSIVNISKKINCKK